MVQEAEKYRAILITTRALDDADMAKQEIHTDKYNDDLSSLMLDMTFALGSMLKQYYSKENALKAIATTIPEQLRSVIRTSCTEDLNDDDEDGADEEDQGTGEDH